MPLICNSLNWIIYFAEYDSLRRFYIIPIKVSFLNASDFAKPLELS